MSERQPGGWSGLAKFAVGSAVLVVLSLGLCGMALSRNSFNGALPVVGLLCFVGGGLGLVISAIIAIVMAISGGKPKPMPPPQASRTTDPPAPPKDDNRIMKDESQE